MLYMLHANAVSAMVSVASAGGELYVSSCIALCRARPVGPA